MTRGASRATALCAMLASLARAQSPAVAGFAGRSGIAGVVSDALGHPIRLAKLLVDGSPISAVTDDSGRFYLRGLPSGKAGFTVAKIGYAPVSFETSLLPDSMIVLAIHMRPVQVLNPVDVRAARVNAYLARTGFTERKKLGLGTFLTPEHIDSVAPGMTVLSDFLHGVPGLDLKCVGAGCVVYGHSPPGCLWLFVDGTPHGTQVQLDSVGVTPGIVAAIEIYDRPSRVPVEFQGAMPQKQGPSFSLAAGCGAIAVWTKARVP